VSLSTKRRNKRGKWGAYQRPDDECGEVWEKGGGGGGGKRVTHNNVSDEEGEREQRGDKEEAGVMHCGSS
jgi:hypothetical protein